AVAVIALAGLFRNGTDDGARDTADGSADGRATNVAGDRAADDCAGSCADTRALLRRRAACNRKSDQDKRNDFLHEGVLQCCAAAVHAGHAHPLITQGNTPHPSTTARSVQNRKYSPERGSPWRPAIFLIGTSTGVFFRPRPSAGWREFPGPLKVSVDRRSKKTNDASGR